MFELFIYVKVLVSSNGKISGGWIRELGFNPYLHQKQIDILV